MTEDQEAKVPYSPPCKDCPDREVGCHGKCEKYLAFRAYRDKMNEERRLLYRGNAVYEQAERAERLRTRWRRCHNGKQR